MRGPAPRVGEHDDEVQAEAAAGASREQRQGTGRSLTAPLDGIRVLDLGLAVAGPFGTLLLADLGADVIKVNALHDGYWHSTHIAMACNRGKRSIAVNLKDPRGMEAVLRLGRDRRRRAAQHALRRRHPSRHRLRVAEAINPR